MEIYKAFCLDVAQGHMKGAPNETGTLETGTLTCSGSAWESPIYGSNGIAWYLNCVRKQMTYVILNY